MGGDFSVPVEGKSWQSHTAATRIDPKKDLSLAVKKRIGNLMSTVMEIEKAIG
jgi:hypothetical protein